MEGAEGVEGDVNLIERHAHIDIFSPFNQGKYESCVLATILYGMALVSDPPISTASDLPSISYSYYKSRKTEDKRCCNEHLCDYACGSIITLGLQIAEGGVVSRTFWPEEEADSTVYVKRFLKDPTMGSSTRHYLQKYEILDATPESVVRSLDRGCPVVVNIRVFEAQHDFFSQVKGEGTSVYSSIYSLPRASGNPREMGHCVLVVGYSAKHRSFLTRNSFGHAWGFVGDFNIPFSQIEPWQVYKAIAICKSVIK